MRKEERTLQINNPCARSLLLEATKETVISSSNTTSTTDRVLVVDLSQRCHTKIASQLLDVRRAGTCYLQAKRTCPDPYRLEI